MSRVGLIASPAPIMRQGSSKVWPGWGSSLMNEWFWAAVICAVPFALFGAFEAVAAGRRKRAAGDRAPLQIEGAGQPFLMGAGSRISLSGCWPSFSLLGVPCAGRGGGRDRLLFARAGRQQFPACLRRPARHRRCDRRAGRHELRLHRPCGDAGAAVRIGAPARSSSRASGRWRAAPASSR